MRILFGVRKPLNVTVSEELIARAKALGINVSRAAEDGIEQAIRAHRTAGFLKGKVGPVPDSFFDPLPEEELRRWVK
jgi:post-segregation antitoxin (ccd killing protein)